MFDDSLQLSEQYFTVLQLIRIFQNWIGETERGVESMGEEYIPLSIFSTFLLEGRHRLFLD